MHVLDYDEVIITTHAKTIFDNWYQNDMPVNNICPNSCAETVFEGAPMPHQRSKMYMCLLYPLNVVEKANRRDCQKKM